MTDSQKLITEYVENGSEAAFRELVSRYVNLVYSAALRLVDHDAHLAEDVVQMVFADLARMARTLSGEVMLGGWLHRHTCFVAAKTMRGERRRQSRERQAVEMNALQAYSEVNFSLVAPLLDEAINELGDLDRTAILLRFFEQHDFRAIGEAIGGSEDSARMRVRRALEKLELLLKRRGVTSTTAALSVGLSANAVQAAPIGMAATVSAFALATGAVPSALTVLAATKTAAMTTMQKTIVTGFLAVSVGTAIYEAHQGADIRSEIHALQQAPLAGQILQLQRERDEATNRLAGLLAENERLKSNPNENELLKLRGKVTQLRAAQAQREDNPTASAAKSWLDRVRQLQEYLEQHPDEKIPEFQFLSDQRWLNAVETSGFQMKDFKKPDDYYRGPIDFLRSEAESDFGVNIQIALRKYSDANHGQFPTDLSQLQPYCDPNVEDILQQLYEIKPASILPASQVKAMNIKTDWVVIRKKRSIPHSTSRGAYFVGGSLWWQSPPRMDDQ
jgi:RNA polymerase sigma factor (sigma-70 family)